jgi:hypothetical protein
LIDYGEYNIAFLAGKLLSDYKLPRQDNLAPRKPNRWRIGNKGEGARRRILPGRLMPLLNTASAQLGDVILIVDLVLDLLAIEADSGDPTGDAWVVAVVDKIVEVEPRWAAHIPALVFWTLCPFAWLPPRGEIRLSDITADTLGERLFELTTKARETVFALIGRVDLCDCSF